MYVTSKNTKLKNIYDSKKKKKLKVLDQSIYVFFHIKSLKSGIYDDKCCRRKKIPSYKTILFVLHF